jgi:hypothetical protein
VDLVVVLGKTFDMPVKLFIRRGRDRGEGRRDKIPSLYHIRTKPGFDPQTPHRDSRGG